MTIKEFIQGLIMAVIVYGGAYIFMLTLEVTKGKL